MVWLNRAAILKCYEEKLSLNFYGIMRGEDHFYPGVQLVTWNLTQEKLHRMYFPATYLKLLTTSILPVGQLQLDAR